jgi:hypothetical protein
VTADGVLPCGRSTGELITLVADSARSAHAPSCPHCSVELARLDREWEAVRRTAASPVRTPPGLVSRVLASVPETPFG